VAEAIRGALAGTRPTAVNCSWAIERMKRLYASVRDRPPAGIRRRLVEEALPVMHASYNARFFSVLFAQRRELPQMW
jgi:methylthioribose-1-phosphate isomerase